MNKEKLEIMLEAWRCSLNSGYKFLLFDDEYVMIADLGKDIEFLLENINENIK